MSSSTHSRNGVRTGMRGRLYAAATAAIVLGASAPALAEANNSAGGQAGGAFMSSYSPRRLPAEPQYQSPAVFSRARPVWMGQRTYTAQPHRHRR
jgi:hypothetical protein